MCTVPRGCFHSGGQLSDTKSESLDVAAVGCNVEIVLANDDGSLVQHVGHMTTIPPPKTWVAQPMLPVVLVGMEGPVVKTISMRVPVVLLAVVAYDGFRSGQWGKEAQKEQRRAG